MFKSAAILASLVSLALAGTAQAGNGRSSSSISLVIVAAATPTGSTVVPSYGDTVTFDVSTPVTDEPFVQLSCYQSGTLVYSSSAGFFAGYTWPWARDFILSSNAWTGGAASCTGTLFYSDGKRFRDLAATSFEVAA